MWITKATATQAAAATKRQQQQQLQFTIHFFVFFTFVGYISLILKVNVCVQAESESRLVDRHPNALPAQWPACSWKCQHTNSFMFNGAHLQTMLLLLWGCSCCCRVSAAESDKKVNAITKTQCTLSKPAQKQVATWPTLLLVLLVLLLLLVGVGGVGEIQEIHKLLASCCCCFYFSNKWFIIYFLANFFLCDTL